MDAFNQHLLASSAAPANMYHPQQRPARTLVSNCGRYTLPPLPPGSILLSDEIIDMNQQQVQPHHQFYSQRSGRRRQNRPRDPWRRSSSTTDRTIESEFENPQAPPPTNYKMRPHRLNRTASPFKKSFSTNSLILNNQQPRQRLYSSDEARTAQPPNNDQQLKTGKKPEKQQSVIVPWAAAVNDESDADQYAQAVATQYQSPNLKIPADVQFKAMEDSGYAFMKRRAIRLTDNLMCIPGVERVIEKRFYVRKNKKTPSESGGTKDASQLSQKSSVSLPKIDEQPTIDDDQYSKKSPVNINGILTELRNLRNDIAQLQVNQAELLSETRSPRGGSTIKFCSERNSPDNAIGQTMMNQRMPPQPSMLQTMPHGPGDYENVTNTIPRQEQYNPIYPTFPPNQMPQQQPPPPPQSFMNPFPNQHVRLFKIQRPPMQMPLQQAPRPIANFGRPVRPPMLQQALYTTRGPISLGSQNQAASAAATTTPEHKTNTSSRIDPLAYSNVKNYELLVREAYGIQDDADQTVNAASVADNSAIFGQEVNMELPAGHEYAYDPNDLKGFEYLFNPQPEYVDSVDQQPPHFQATTHDANALYYMANNSIDPSNMFSDEAGNAFTHEIDMPQSSIVEDVVNQYYANYPELADEKLNNDQGNSGDNLRQNDKEVSGGPPKDQPPNKMYC